MIKKIIFIDDKIGDFFYHINNYEVLDAKYGYTRNQYKLEKIGESSESVNIFTNDLYVWGNNKYNWDGTLNKSKAYIYYDVYTIPNIQELTDKEIRPFHNIKNMYIAGVFNLNNKK